MNAITRAQLIFQMLALQIKIPIAQKQVLKHGEEIIHFLLK